jgi:GTP cyclohydrolase I
VEQMTTGNTLVLTHADCEAGAARVALQIIKNPMFATTHRIKLFGVPRGGIPAAYLVARAIGQRAVITSVPDDAHVFIDDIVDSGATLERWTSRFPCRPFHALFTNDGSWHVFPWEGGADDRDSAARGAEDIPTRLLQWVGEDPKREGLRDTPQRFLKAWKSYTQGYSMRAEDVLKTFEDGGEKYDELVLVRDIPVYSHCEHHLAPFFGHAAVAYIPDGRVVGLSKLARLVDIYARRLQVQERLTQQIAHALNDALVPRGVAVVVECRHMCMEARGVRTSGAVTSTSCLLGALKANASARAEFLSLLR